MSSFLPSFFPPFLSSFFTFLSGFPLSLFFEGATGLETGGASRAGFFSFLAPFSPSLLLPSSSLFFFFTSPLAGLLFFFSSFSPLTATSSDRSRGRGPPPLFEPLGLTSLGSSPSKFQSENSSTAISSLGTGSLSCSGTCTSLPSLP